MGVHLLRGINKKVAVFLNLPKPESYTGHALRRSSANTLAEAGVSTTSLKKHFNWKNEGTALKYVENTNSAKLAISEKIGESSKFRRTTKEVQEACPTSKVLNVANCSNIIINF